MGELRFLTAGESHGRGLIVIIEGMVAGLALDEEYVARDLKRRQGGYGRGGRMQIECDRAEIVSGVRHGLTIGSPISLVIWNRDWENWREVMSVAPVSGRVEAITRPRPGHADLAGVAKYGLDDIRPVLERSSARETATRVASGAVARRLLDEFGVSVRSRTLSIGPVRAARSRRVDWDVVEASPVRCADVTAAKAMMAAIDGAKQAGDTLGGVFEIVASGVPVGLGSHVHWDRRLDGRLAQAVMSIPSVKGVEIGGGFATARVPGSRAHDAIYPASRRSPYPWRRLTNQAGGLEGGITNGEPLVVRAAVKPISTLAKPLPSIDLITRRAAAAHYERSDVCIVPAAGVVGEAMVALVLASAMLEKFGGDNLPETVSSYRRYLDSLSLEAK